VDDLYLDQFWHFILVFEDMAKGDKKKHDKNDLSWLRDPKRKKK
jgi:hypothetical protein